MEKEFTNSSGTVCIPSPAVDVPPSSRKFMLHVGFDFAQQVHLPSDPLQPGPIYFLTPRKCGIFGVCREPFQKQVKTCTLKSCTLINFNRY